MNHLAESYSQIYARAIEFNGFSFSV